MNNFSTRQNVLNSTVIIDTEYVVGNYSNPSTDPGAPTPIGDGAVYIVATCGKAMLGSGSDNITMLAQPGDYVNWFGVSESNNFGSEVILYNTAFYNGVDVFSPPNFVQLRYTTVQPRTGYPQFEQAGESATAEQETATWFVTAVVVQQGAGVYQLQFALYVDSELYGYFQCEITMLLISPHLQVTERKP